LLKRDEPHMVHKRKRNTRTLGEKKTKVSQEFIMCLNI
jgi:hypothetical protein